MANPYPRVKRGEASDPEDLRVLARVLEMQKTLVHRKRAIEILESLTDKNLATSEDRFVLPVFMRQSMIGRKLGKNIVS